MTAEDKIATLRARVDELEIDLRAMTTLRDSWRDSATDIAGQRDMWEKAYRGWMKIGTDARARVAEGIEVVDAIQALPPERIGSREYGWMRDWLAQARAARRPEGGGMKSHNHYGLCPECERHAASTYTEGCRAGIEEVLALLPSMLGTELSDVADLRRALAAPAAPKVEA